MKSYTDLEQSKKLADILPLESADMSYSIICNIGQEPYHCNVPTFTCVTHGDIPCWSLTALLGVLPKYEIYNNGETIQLDVGLEALATEGDETLLDLAVDMIIHLHEIEML